MLRGLHIPAFSVILFQHGSGIHRESVMKCFPDHPGPDLHVRSVPTKGMIRRMICGIPALCFPDIRKNARKKTAEVNAGWN